MWINGLVCTIELKMGQKNINCSISLKIDINKNVQIGKIFYPFQPEL